MARLNAKTVAIKSLSDEDRTRMFGIFHQYYDLVSEAAFQKDLSAKDHVILLYTPEDDVIHGFSTLKNTDFVVDKKRVRGVFSGDTVIEKDFWGQGSLGIEFLKYLFRQKAKSPFTPFYWFLISKGYKTYLLMANNFPLHYPRYEEPTPAFEQAIMNTFAADMFGEAYDEDRGLVVFEKSQGQLKDGVAGITDEQRVIPRVAFFEEKNPTWMDGSELVCTAKMTWAMPFQYWWKKRRPASPATLPKKVTS